MNAIQVLDSGVLLATGNETKSLLLANMAGLTLTDFDQDTVLVSNEKVHEPVLLRYSPNYEDLIEDALNLLQKKIDEGFPVVLLLPDKNEPQYESISEDLLKNTNNLEVISSNSFHKKLNEILSNLQQKIVKQVTVFGLDSLTRHNVLNHKMEQGLLRTQNHTDGRAQGEGCGWFTLSLAQENDANILWHSSSDIHINSSTDNTNYQGLSLSLTSLINDFAVDAPEAWIYGSRQTAEDDLEAFIAFQKFWPNNDYKWLEQLCPARCIGDLGAAALPVAIALGCERLKFKPDPKKSVLISNTDTKGLSFSLKLSL